MIVTDVYTAPKCVKTIERKLMDAIIKADDANLAHWFQQCPHIHRRRLELKDTRAKILKAKDLITKFMKGNTQS